ncbi:cell division topological specificity factor MinE [Clostridium hydrogeniformans]|uniref:cell division topological specificity factor MinE n=1 Tax=Clostridium hydrogeniformans TaxID=349933 RepID=UPI00048748B7|nr:cell division topological specificity factor MinE [Clostridium hydrogeniformans]
MDFLRKLTSKGGSKNVAKDRLKLILIHDRGDMPTEIIDKIKNEILEVISKYVDIESEEIDIAINQGSEGEGDSPALVANIPIRSLRNK